MNRPTWVVVPARDEAEGIGACLAAIAVAAQAAPGPVRVLVVDDGSTDRTAEVARAALRRAAERSAGHEPTDRADEPLTTGSLPAASVGGAVLPGRGEGVGWARRVGFEAALGEAEAAGATTALLATTDADSTVRPDWLAVLHGRLDEGHGVVAGDVLLDPLADPRLVSARAARLAIRLAALPAGERHAPHPHFAGSNLAFELATLRALGPLPTPAALEDQAILERCRALGIPVLRDHAAQVVTSARLVGRAAQGLADALTRDAARLAQGGGQAEANGASSSASRISSIEV